MRIGGYSEALQSIAYVEETIVDDEIMSWQESVGPQCLGELSFVEGHLSGSQLIRMLPSSTARLQRLFLFHTGGLTTRDIFAFLSLTHSTLTQLHILESHIQPATGEEPDQDPGYPLDDWIAKMTYLTVAVVPGTIASVKSISNREKKDLQHVLVNTYNGTPPTRIVIDYDHVYDFLPNVDVQQPAEITGRLVSAIGRSGWDTIVISVPPTLSIPAIAWRGAFAAAYKNEVTLLVFGMRGDIVDDE